MSSKRKNGAISLDGKRGKKLVMARAGAADLLTGRQTARGRQEDVRYEYMIVKVFERPENSRSGISTIRRWVEDDCGLEVGCEETLVFSL